MPLIPLHVSALFIVLVFGVAFLILIAVYVACRRTGLKLALRRNYFFFALFAILGWLVFTLLLSTSGAITQIENYYARVAVIVGPPFGLIAWLLFSRRFNKLITPIDNFWFIYLQSYRILREFILLLLFRYNVIPQQMTLEGKNFDVLIGVTAPFIAYYCYKKMKWYKPITLGWHVAGLIIIANTLYVLFTGSNQTGAAGNTDFMFSFPFVWLPSFLAPFGVLLHFISIRKLLKAQQ